MKIRQITETTAGATSSGSVASVARPLGKMQERTQVAGLQPAEKIMKGKAKKKGPYGNSLVEGKIKDIAYDLEHMDSGNFKKKYGKTKEEMRASLKEEKIAEADLIIVPGMRKSKDKSFIPHKEDRRDHEVEMARSDLLAAAKNAMRMYHLLKDRTEDQGLMGWQQSYITLATDYLQSVADNLEYDARTDEMTGGVLAGGMSNFEEGVAEGSLNEFAPDGFFGGDEGGGKGPKAKAKAQMIKAYGPGIITFRKTSNGGYFVQHEDDFGDTNSHQYDPQTGKVDFSGVTRSSYYGEGRYYDPMGDERREQSAMDQERRDFKRREMDAELGHEKNNYAVHIDGRSWKVFGDKAHADAVARKLRMKGKKAEVKITGAPVSETQDVVNELSPQTKKSYAAAAKQDKEFNQRGIAQALDRAEKDQHPGRAEWEDEAKFLQSVNAKRDRGLKRAGVEEEKVRLDPKCWKGKHKEGTKMKGGVRVNNCVPNESVQVDEKAKKPGLWANIHAKRERIKHGSGERMRKPGSKGAPTAQALKQSQKTSKKK